MLQSETMSLTHPTSSAHQFHRVLTAELHVIAGLTDDLVHWAETFEVPAATLARIGLMLDELITNIVLHGYKNQPGTLEVSAKVEEQSLIVSLRDEAFEYDPLQTSETDTSSAIEDRKMGGLGIQFVRRMADTLHYERQLIAGRWTNVLTLTKHF